MKIMLSPVRMEETLEVTRQGDTLTVNGEAFDFSPLTEGATLPREAIKSDWFCGPVERTGGELVVTLRLPHGANAPESTRFPQPLYMTADGAVPLPTYDLPAALAEVQPE
ncbi:MAG: hypothetical protein E6Q70_10025 [Pseudomonas monteilii]|nr:MAG: hypothetical protein E6Q70_10025 [Pseudomonas monteilii]